MGMDVDGPGGKADAGPSASDTGRHFLIAGLHLFADHLTLSAPLSTFEDTHSGEVDSSDLHIHCVSVF
jgi:hypothetical protein